MMNRQRLTFLVLQGMGLYYVITGIWPLVHMKSFLLVTGPKIDLWLVNTVGLLILVSGAVFLLAAFRRRFSEETLLLAVGDALVLTAIDVVYVLDGTLRPIYLADAFVEIVLAVLLVALWFSAGRSKRSVT